MACVARTDRAATIAARTVHVAATAARMVRVTAAVVPVALTISAEPDRQRAHFARKVICSVRVSVGFTPFSHGRTSTKCMVLVPACAAENSNTV